MASQPLLDPDPDDPAEILKALPEQYAEYFRADYGEALEKAKDPGEFPALRTLLRRWRLRALMYNEPGYEDSLTAAQAGDWGDCVPLEEAIARLPQA